MVTSIKGKSQDQRKRKLNEDAGACHAGMLNPPRTSPSPAHCDVLLLEYESQPSHWPGGDCESQAFILEMPKWTGKKTKEERRGDGEALARGRGRGQRQRSKWWSSPFVHLDSSPTAADGKWEQTWLWARPGSAVRRKATTCLRASCSILLAQCGHPNSRKCHMSRQDPSGQAALHTIGPHGSLQTNCAVPLWVQSWHKSQRTLPAPTPLESKVWVHY